MRPDGINGSAPVQQPSLTEKIDKVDTSDTANLSKNVNDISTDVNKKIQEFFSQDSEEGVKISKNEKTDIGTIKTSLMSLYYRVRNEYVKAEDKLVNTYKQIANNLLDLIKKAKNAQDGKNHDAVALEPKDTDSQSEQVKSEKTEVTSTMLRIPDRKFYVLSDDKRDCEQIKQEYIRCIDDTKQSNRKIASDLKCFQEKYKQQLQEVASSIHDDGKYIIETLYDQIGSQIRYYDNLADKDAKKNKQDLVYAMTQTPAKPTAEQVAAHRAEGPDPRSNWAKIVNPD